MNTRLRFFAAIVATISLVPVLSADPVAELFSFRAGTTAKSAEVNSNFGAIHDAVNDNDARIAALESEIADLNAALANVLQINQYLSLETVNAHPAIRVTGANLQLVNGLGETATANGTGNLLVGYDEVTTSTRMICSDGQFATESECAAPAVWAASHKAGSHGVIIGPQHNYSSFAVFVAGIGNSVNGDYSSVSGGSRNTASGSGSSVSGGSGNRASGTSSSVSGGFDGVVSGQSASISGGYTNTASGYYSNVSGGLLNTASGFRSSVSGGRENTASGSQSSVSGGELRNASGQSNWTAGSLKEDK